MNKKDLQTAISILSGTSRKYKLREGEGVSITSWPRYAWLDKGGYAVTFTYELRTSLGREQGSDNLAISLDDVIERFTES
jgi:hypothetical protein